MKVDAILKAKGGHVTVMPKHISLGAAVQRLAEERIGAIVVSNDGATVDGIITERDIIRMLARDGASALDRSLGEAMKHNVVTCSRDDRVKQLMVVMTRCRVRHLPVIEDGRLVGIVSIGDLVKSRLDEVELETNVLRDAYIATH